MRVAPPTRTLWRASSLRNGLYHALLSLTFLGQAILVFAQTPATQESLSATSTVPSSSIATQLKEPIARQPSAQSRPPSGFDFSQPETMVFDLYLADVFQGAMVVRYTEQWFEIEDPADAIGQLKGVKHVEELGKLLQGRIERSREIAGVGSVRYNLRNFSVVLALDPSYLEEQSLDLSSKLPDPENKFSLQQDLFTSGSQSLRGSSNNESSITHMSMASVGRYYTKVNGTAATGQPYDMRSAYAGATVSDFSMDGGLLESEGNSFAQSLSYAGGRLQTSKAMLSSQGVLQGSKLEVFVPSRAEVQFFRSGQMISVQVLDFGLREIDTSYFPEGNYDVEIVIKEDNGTTTRENRYFSKSGFLAVRSIPVFTFGLGGARTELHLNESPLYEASVRWRALDNAELFASLSGVDNMAVTEFGTRAVLGDNVRMGSSMGLSNKGGFGVGMNGNATLWGFSGHASFVKTLISDNSNDSSAQRTSGTRDYSGNLDQLDSKREAISGGIRTAVGPLDLNFVYSRYFTPAQDFQNTTNSASTTDQKELTYAWGPRLIWHILRGKEQSLSLQLEDFRTDSGRRDGVWLAYQLNFGKGYSLSSSARAAHEDGYDNAYSTNTLSWDGRGSAKQGTKAKLSSDYESIGQSGGRSNFWTNQGTLDYVGSYLSGGAFLRDVGAAGSGQTTAGGNARSGFMVDSEGGVSVASSPGEGGVFIARVDSDTPDAIFDVVVNGQVVEKVKSGRQAAISLAPFRTYSISVRPAEESDLVDLDAKVYHLTFFPGNIIRKEWQAKRILIAVGRILDKDGNPIPHQRIRGARDYSFTEDDGSFQAEISGDETLSIQSSQYSCSLSLPLPEDANKQYLHDFGNVICK